MSDQFIMKIDTNVLNHLGINLYSNLSAVLSEVVANSWDAMAKRVDILVDREANKIIIKDDGFGMSKADIQDKFLTVGYRKRDIPDPKITRQPMGRKGIGKLSLLSIANKIEIHTKSVSESNAFKLDLDKLKAATESGENYKIDTAEFNDTFIQQTGTTIILTDFRKGRSLSTITKNLKQRLARRFTAIGENFQIFIDNEEVTYKDRNLFNKAEFCWLYNQPSNFRENFSEEVTTLEDRHKYVIELPNDTDTEKTNVSFKGWLALAPDTKVLKLNGDNYNTVSLIVNKKMAKEDILSEIEHNGIFISYVFGEIEADFLDDDSREDIATSSRQDFDRDDKRYSLLLNFLKEEVKQLGVKRAEIKKANIDKDLQQLQDLKPVAEWLKLIKGKDRENYARELLASVNSIATDMDRKKTIFKHAILAFEQLSLDDSLSKLKKINEDNIEQYLSAAEDLQTYEAMCYFGITKERLEIVKKFQSITEENHKEKVLQEFLFNHLWLINPAWDRVTDNVKAHMEQKVELALKQAVYSQADDIKKGRIDIKYATPDGKHAIIELKRYSVKPKPSELSDQIKFYREAIIKEIQAHSPDKIDEIKQISLICIIGDASYFGEDDYGSFNSYRIKLYTYDQLIESAKQQYSEYINKEKEISKINSILDQLN